MKAEFYQEGMFMAATVSPSVASVELEDLKKIKRLLPLVQPLLQLSGSLQKHVPGMPTAGVSADEDPNLIELLDTLEVVGRDLAKHGKTVRVLHHKAEVVLLGKNAGSIIMGLGGYKHVNIKRKLVALRLAAMFKGVF